MRELRTCDFCGSDAVGVFEVLPPELTPAEDQKRVVLCDHCEETLTDVISPLLRRLGADADVAAGIDGQSPSAHQTQSSAVTVPDDTPTETTASVTTTSEKASAESIEPADSGSVDSTPTPSEPADDDALDGEDDSSEHDTGSPDADTDTDQTDSVDDGTDTPAEPPQFRTVVRILQNREFPVERSDVESLASNAYDLDDQEVADIFDYAVERGLLVDDSGTLRKP